MLYSCIHMATVGVKGLSDDDDVLSVCLRCLTFVRSAEGVAVTCDEAVSHKGQ